MSELEADFMAIYEALLGDTDLVPWVENIWAADTGFARGYNTLWKSRESLAQRLGIEDFCDDADMEDIMYAVLNIQEDLCRRMFYCTLRYAEKGYKL